MHKYYAIISRLNKFLVDKRLNINLQIFRSYSFLNFYYSFDIPVTNCTVTTTTTNVPLTTVLNNFYSNLATVGSFAVSASVETKVKTSTETSALIATMLDQPNSEITTAMDSKIAATEKVEAIITQFTETIPQTPTMKDPSSSGITTFGHSKTTTTTTTTAALEALSTPSTEANPQTQTIMDQINSGSAAFEGLIVTPAAITELTVRTAEAIQQTPTLLDQSNLDMLVKHSATTAIAAEQPTLTSSAETILQTPMLDQSNTSITTFGGSRVPTAAVVEPTPTLSTETIPQKPTVLDQSNIVNTKVESTKVTTTAKVEPTPTLDTKTISQMPIVLDQSYSEKPTGRDSMDTAEVVASIETSNEKTASMKTMKVESEARLPIFGSVATKTATMGTTTGNYQTFSDAYRGTGVVTESTSTWFNVLKTEYHSTRTSRVPPAGDKGKSTKDPLSSTVKRIVTITVPSILAIIFLIVIVILCVKKYQKPGVVCNPIAYEMKEDKTQENRGYVFANVAFEPN